MTLDNLAVGAAAMEFGKHLPQNPAQITSAVWMAALRQALEVYEATRGEPLTEAYMRHVVECSLSSFLNNQPRIERLNPEQFAAVRAIESRLQNEN